jgi:hypothetical protein
MVVIVIHSFLLIMYFYVFVYVCHRLENQPHGKDLLCSIALRRSTEKQEQK